MALYSVRLECVQGSSDKFYLQRVVPGGGGAFFVELTYGRNGAAGVTTRSDPHASLAAARAALDAMAAKKLRKGYTHVPDGGGAALPADEGARGCADAAADAPPSKKAGARGGADAAADAPPAKKARAGATPAAKPAKPAALRPQLPSHSRPCWPARTTAARASLAG
jgi:hypothetical protein